MAWSLALRIPQWCSAPTLTVNGVSVSIASRTKGYVILQRDWKAGDRVELVLPMEVQLVRSASRIRETFGKVAVQRGPLVWCAEEVDNGTNLHELSLGDAKRAVVESCEALGVGALRLRLPGVRSLVASKEAYTTVAPSTEKVDVVLVPYHLWGNRGSGEMRVWLAAHGENS
jgi:DUF1680 family protein